MNFSPIGLDPRITGLFDEFETSRAKVETIHIENYFNGLHYGGSRPLPELFEKFGIKFDFSRDTVKPLIHAIYNEYKELNNE